MLCPSSIAFAERQKLSKSTWKAIDCVPILSRVPPRYSISIHSEAASAQKPAVISAASRTVELPLLRTSGSPLRINRDHKEHHTRMEAFQHFSLSAIQLSRVQYLPALLIRRRRRRAARLTSFPNAERGGFEPPTPGLPT